MMSASATCERITVVNVYLWRVRGPGTETPMAPSN